ncbi:MAG: hypothetical protein IKU37_10140 [Candidatus Gastranaerophilales bacterium]|nr:hypothetical protein [Candidatus Gastranaerophilales bacterium]
MTPLISRPTMDLTQASGLNAPKTNKSLDTSMSLCSAASQAAGDIASGNELTEASAQEIYDMQEATESLQEVNANKDTGSVLSGIISMLGNLIAALQSIIGSNSLNTEGVNNDTKVKPDISVNKSKENDAVEKSNNNTATANVGDVVDVNIAGIGEIKDAEVMDKAGLESYFSKISFHPSTGRSTSGGPMIDMSSLNDVRIYKVTDEDGLDDTIYITNANNEIMYEASFYMYDLSIEERHFTISKYTKVGEFYNVDPRSGRANWQGSGSTFGELVKIYPYTVNKQGKVIAHNGKCF